MNIYTKFRPNQAVFFMQGNRICDSLVKDVYVKVYHKQGDGEDVRHTSIDYLLWGEDKRFQEEMLFPTKQSLLDSL